MFHKLNPAGRAGSHHRQHAAVRNSSEELIAFFHNGKVGSEVNVEDVVEAEASKCRNHFALGIAADGISEFFADANTRCGSGADDNVLIGVRKVADDVVDFVLFAKCARGAYFDTLTAADARIVRKVGFKRASDMRVESAGVCADNRDGLIFFAGSHATTAKHALVVVADKIRRARIDGIIRFSPLKRSESQPSSSASS